MTIQMLFGITCTNCGTPLSEPNGGDALHESISEVKAAANMAGWAVNSEVPNGSMWDFCPKCAAKEGKR